MPYASATCSAAWPAAISPSTDGRRIDNSFLVMLNAYHEDLEFHLPALPVEMSWSRLVDTAEPSGLVIADRVWHSGDIFPLKARSFVLFIDATTPDPGHG